MKMKTLKRILTMCLATSLMATSIPTASFAKEETVGTDGTEVVTELGPDMVTDMRSDKESGIPENNLGGNHENLKGQEPDTDLEDVDYHFTGLDIDLFSIDEKTMGDEELSHLILSSDERDVKAFLDLLSEDDRDALLQRDTALTQPVDVYQTDEDGSASCEHFDTYMDYLAGISENAGYKFTNTTGNYYINWYKGTTSEGQTTIAVSGFTKGDTDNTQQTDLTWKVSNPKHDFKLKAGGKKSWPNSLKSAQAKTNYQQAWADFTYTKPISYKASVTYDAANNGSGEYRMYQGTHDSATGCLKTNTTGTGAGYYIEGGTLYTGSSTYTSATTETFNIGPNFTNLGCTDSAANNNTIARITLNPVYMTITWNQNGGSGSDCQPTSVLYGNTHGQATAPSRAGFGFAGWSGYNASTAVTSNVTYTASWNPNQYTITYDGAGGSLSKNSDTVTYGGDIPAMPTASKTGHKLTGWSWSGYSGSGVYTYDGNSTATAIWEALKYTIYYNANGGQVSPASNGVTYGQPCPTAPTPTRKGYTFTGWSGGTYAGTYQTAGDTTVMAGWKANNYAVTFNTDGGSNVEEIKTNYDAQFALPAAPVKADYNFAGWSDGTNTYPAGKVVSNLTSEPDGRVTLKAEWIPSTFTIHFDSNEGAEISDVKYSFGENTALPTPARADEQVDNTIRKFTFAGWIDEKGNLFTTAQDVTREMIPEDGILKLTARWDVTETQITDVTVKETEKIYEEKTIVEKPIYETNNYTNNYNMTDEQAQIFLEKLMQGIAAEIKIHGIRFEVVKNADGTVTIRLIDLGNAKEVQIPDSIRIGDAVIPITIIDKGAFQGNTTIERLILGKNVTTIKESAFEGCTNLKQISFNEGLVTIEKRAFYGCTSLKEITTSKTLKSIGESAFENCTSLSKVTLNEGLLDIGAKAFRGCKSITSITIPKSVLKIGNQAFENCTKLKTLKFASGSELQSIGKSAFAGCKALVSVKLPNKLTVLSDKAFYNCVKLKKVTGGKGLVTIGAKAFMNCKVLTKITLYTNVSKVGKQAFYRCKKLKKVTIKSKVLTKVGAKAFKKTHKKIVFYVPDKARREAYKKLLKGKY
ncbi:MAG: leucine-rich repeat protein [Lachnospiraceae bacterium]|nr:leucine-rich repeat protein [Lachnospiraceae bacterium]